MNFKNESKPGTVTTEVAIGISLAVVVLFVTLGLFNDNLSAMFANSNLKSFFNPNSSKTTYDSFNRDYSNSQINVQVMGEQGLEMLRRKANNLALEQIQKVFDGDTSTTNANSIAYLTLAINAIVGEPHVGVYMNKDSDKFCNEDDLGGYNYKIDYNGSSITIKKVDPTGKNVSESRTLNIDSSALNNVSITTNASGRSDLDTKKKYEFIKELSINAKPDVYSKDLLINTFSTFTNTKITSIPELKSKLTNTYLGGLTSSIQAAHDECTAKLFGKDLNFPKAGKDSQCGGFLHNTIDSDKNFVSKQEAAEFKDYVNSLSKIINQINSNNPADIINAMVNSEYFTKLQPILKNDHDKNSCGLFTNGLKDIADAYSVSINIPDCTLYHDRTWK